MARLVVANLYVGNRHIDADLNLLARLDPAAVFVCEAARWHEHLDDLGDLHIGRSTKARRNTGVLARDIEIHDTRIEHLSDDTGYDVGKERWAYVVRCTLAGVETSLIAVHLTAGLARDKNMHANRRGLVKISAICETEQAAGYTPIVGGDHNDRGKVRPDLTPQQAYDALGLTYVWHRNDGIAYDPKVWRRVDFRTVNPTGSDHDFVVCDLTPVAEPEKEDEMRFVSRAQWGARSGASPSTHPIGETEGVTFHWEGPKMGGFTHDRCKRLVQSIQRFHQITRGWADIAYNAVVCPHGYVFEGRGLWTTSAANGDTDSNDDWYAVCYLGGMGDGFTEEGKAAFVEARDWLVSKGGAGRRVNGHRDHKATACPGDAIYHWLHSREWGAPNEEDDMPSPEDLWNHPLPDYSTEDKKDTSRAQTILAQTHNRALDARRAAHEARTAAQAAEAAVKALAKALGPEVEAAVEEALKDAVVQVDVTVGEDTTDA